MKRPCRSNPRYSVINIGCGLETAFFRIKPDSRIVTFYEMDLPDVIATRKIFQYFHEEQVRAFMKSVKENFENAGLIFDAMTKKAVSYAAKYIKKTGNNDAMLYFGTDDPEAFVMSQGYDLIETRPFFTQARKQLKKKLKLYTRIAMKVVDEGGRRGFLVHCG